MTGMCGGVSRTGGSCGALLGGIAAIGLLTGRDAPDDDKTLAYTLSYHFTREFEQLFGSTSCSGVLPCDISTPGGANEFSMHEYGTTLCPEVAAKAARLVQELYIQREKLIHPLL